MGIGFFINSILLGIGLAMDAFSVSLANGLNEPSMKSGRMNRIAGTFGFFQWFMPMAGWVCVHTVVGYFRAFEKFIPWIALLLLVYIGGKMIAEAKRGAEDADAAVGLSGLLLQGIATSIDALSVGFTTADYDLAAAFLSSLLIGAVTYVICLAGIAIGKKAGTKLAGKASVFGGVILIIIGLEIFIKGVIL